MESLGGTMHEGNYLLDFTVYHLENKFPSDVLLIA